MFGTCDDAFSTYMQICSANVPVEGGGLSVDPWLAMRLPPASPFDNFLRAAGC